MFCKNCGNFVRFESKFCSNCGNKITINKFTLLKQNLINSIKRHRIILIIIFIVVIIFLIYSQDSSSEATNSTTPNDSTTEEVLIDSLNQNQIASSVVNIFCPSSVSEEESTGGSGIIITESGVILTNSHIIPQDKNNIHVDDVGCLVVLPDPITGQVKDIYLANPIVIPNLSDKYDLAFMSIYSAYYDDEKEENMGVYPRKFPTFDYTTKCTTNNVKLGENIRIYGYPAISGGYSLTITDGIVSSFLGDGLIVTSAKISHGNSGGLAVNSNGCMVGIPSMVSSDENESLGVIISKKLVDEFSNEVLDYLDKLENKKVL